MKIVHLASEYPPQKVFGLGRFVHGLAREQARRGHEVHVVTNSLGGRLHDIVDQGVHVHRVDFPPPPKPADEGATVTQFNTQLIERVFRDRLCPDADVVNAHDWLTALAGKVIARRSGATFVVTVHDVVVGKRFGKLDNDAKYVGNIEHWMCREADRLICVSEHTRREVIKAYGAPSGKTFAIHNAVSERDFPAPEPKLLARFRRALAREDEKIVLYVGRLDREKGVDVLLRAFARLPQGDGPAKLVIAGTGRLEGDLRKLAEDLGIDERVIFAGYAAGGVLNHLYRSSQVLAVPSLYEPFGIVALEGMICGLPVVASNTGGLAEIVRDGETGIFVPPGDADALAGALSRVLSDGELASRLGASGRERARGVFSWSTMSKRIENIIEKPDKISATVYREPRPAEVPASAARRDPGRILLLVLTHEPDFHLLEANRVQFRSLVERGHMVAFLCDAGEGGRLAPAWHGVASVIEASTPKGHEHIAKKMFCGYKAALAQQWDWVVKIDSDVLISGDIPSFLTEQTAEDAVGAPCTFEPGIRAIREAGPPELPADALERVGHRYLWGYFYAVRRDALSRALPLFGRVAPRMRTQDPTITAALAAIGARIRFCDHLSRYVSQENPCINLRGPVFHVETRDVQERRFFSTRASALFRLSQEGADHPRAVETAQRGGHASLDLSVVIHTRNRKAMLLRLLATLRNDWPEDENLELVIIDYGGTDGLAADLCGLRWQVLRYVHVDAPGRFSSAHARNIGYKASRGRWILSLDCDLLAPPGMVGMVLGFYRQHPETAVYGPVYKLMPHEQDALEAGDYDPVSDFARLRELAAPHRIDAPSGAILSAPRDRILAIGGYDEEFVGYGFQDIDLIERLRRSGLPQAFPEGIFALHQFHGYPVDYNTAEIEARNRQRFMSTRSTVEQNVGRPWGRLPQGNLALQSVDWLECKPRSAQIAPPMPVPCGGDVVVWCESASPRDVELVKAAAVAAEGDGTHWRWLASRLLSEQRPAALLGGLPSRHSFEVHSTAQVTTQLGRARLVAVLGSASHAREIAECGRRLEANVVAVGSPVAEDVPLVESPSALVERLEASRQRTPGATPTPCARSTPRHPSDVRKILVSMDEGIGNMLMLTPTLKALHSLLPKAEIHVVGKRPALDILEGMPGITRVIGRTDRPDAAYDMLLATCWRGSMEARLPGVRFRHKPLLAGGMRLDVHESKQHMQLARMLGYEGSTPSPYCAQEHVDLGGQNGPRIGLADCANPRPKWESKRWPHYRELAGLLVEKGYQVFAFGGEEDAARHVDGPWPEGVTSYQGRLSIRQTAGALAQMDVVVANDCGLAHVAAAVGAPTVCLWGPTSRAKNEPLGENVFAVSLDLPCSPCQMTSRWVSCRSWTCITGLGSDMVLGCVESSLQRRGRVLVRHTPSAGGRHGGGMVYSRRTYEDEYHRAQYRLHERTPAEVRREWERKGYRRRAEDVWRAMPFPIGGKVLEVACHHGKTAVWMLDTFPSIESMHMFDFSSVAVEHCRRITRHREKMTIWQGDVTDIPTERDYYDFVNCTDVTEHLPYGTYRKMVGELHRVLRPGGHLLLMQGVADLPEHINVLPEGRLIADFESSGFSRECELPHRHHLLRAVKGG